MLFFHNAMKKVAFDSLSSLERTALGLAENSMNQAHYTDYSHFHVGAAVITKSGRLYAGSNQENAAIVSTMCGERLAMYNAMAHNDIENLETVVIITRGEKFESKRAAPSCGACRQINYETALRAGRDVKFIFSSTDKSDIIVTTASELLPLPYSPVVHGFSSDLVDRVFGTPEIDLTEYDDLPNEYRNLVDKAHNAWKKSYSMNTGVKEGIAALMEDNKVIKGKYIENAAFGSSISSVTNVVSKIHDYKTKNIKAVAFVVGRETGPYRVAGPDGDSRQKLYEIKDGTGLDFDVILFTPDLKQVTVKKMSELLPYAFGPSDLHIETGAYFHKS